MALLTSATSKTKAVMASYGRTLAQVTAGTCEMWDIPNEESHEPEWHLRGLKDDSHEDCNQDTHRPRDCWDFWEVWPGGQGTGLLTHGQGPVKGIMTTLLGTV